MANFKSDLITAKDQLAVSNKQVDGDRSGGNLLLATAIVTLAGTEATNDTVQLFDLPAGAVIVPQLCHVTGADPGTTLTLDIGDAGDTDRYADGVVLSNGGQVAFCAPAVPDAVPNPYRPAVQTRVYATVTGASSITAGVKLAFTIAFRAKA